MRSSTVIAKILQFKIGNRVRNSLIRPKNQARAISPPPPCLPILESILILLPEQIAIPRSIPIPAQILIPEPIPMLESKLIPESIPESIPGTIPELSRYNIQSYVWRHGPFGA